MSDEVSLRNEILQWHNLMVDITFLILIDALLFCIFALATIATGMMENPMFQVVAGITAFTGIILVGLNLIRSYCWRKYTGDEI